MRLRKPLLAHVLLFVAFVGAFGYLFFPSLHVMEVGLACACALYVWLAASTRVDHRSVLYVYLPALALGAWVLLYAVVFANKADAPLWPSILAQRYNAFVLLGPVVYVLVSRGWRLIDLQRVFLAALLACVAGFVVADFTVTPSPVLLSGHFMEPALHGVYTERFGDEHRDPDRLLRSLNPATLFLALYFGRRMLQARGAPSFLFSSAMVFGCVTLLLFGLPRALLASVAIALVVYAVYLSKPGRAKLMVLLLPMLVSIFVLLLPGLSNGLNTRFAQDWAYRARVGEAQIAWESVLEHPLFGMGQGSHASATFRDLFGGWFYPSDIGLLGATVQYGLFGLLLYLVVVGWLFLNLLDFFWEHARKVGLRQKAFLWALLLICLTFIVSTPLEARFIFSEGKGLPIAALAWGLIVAHKAPARVAPSKSRPRRRPRRGRTTARRTPTVYR